MKPLTYTWLVILGLLILATIPPQAASSPPPTATATQPPRPDTPGPPQRPTATPPGSRYPVIDPAREPRMWCRQANPACHREPWWAEWDEAPLAGRCQYAFLPAGFVSDCALAEAVVLLAQWDEGARLLQEAASWRVTIVIVPQPVVGSPGVVAHYDATARTVRVGDAWSQVSTWALSAVLAHELLHARQDRLGQLNRPCRAVELPKREIVDDTGTAIHAGRNSAPPPAGEGRCRSHRQPTTQRR